MIKQMIGCIINKLIPVRIHGKQNTLVRKSPLGKGFKIRINGDKNYIYIGERCTLTNTFISLSGNQSKIVIEDDVRFIGPCHVIVGEGSTLIIKKNVGIRGVEFNLHGGSIEVGELCMFIYGIVLRNHDSHRVIDPVTNKVLNPPKDIVLGEHVWIAQNATILKGCHIGANSIVGFGSIVTKSCAPGSILAGNPAKVVKENVNWDY